MIYETIVSTIDTAGKPHVAPFGIRQEGALILIAPFRPSITLDNLLATRKAIVNFIDDVRIFAGALTGRTEWPYRAASRMEGFVLQAALAHKELELARIEDDANRPQLFFRVVHEETHAAFKGFNRAQSAVIELAILVSRLHMLPMEKIESELRYLEQAFNKTAGEHERQAWCWLLEKIENHKAGLSGMNLA